MENLDEEFRLEGKEFIKVLSARVPEAKLYRGTCSMEGCSLEIRIKRGPEINKETYDIMKMMKHNSLVPHLNFIPDSGPGSSSGSSSHGRLAVPIVGSTFENWMKEHGENRLFHHGNMTALFKSMIVDICDVVEKLSKSDISIKNLDLNNLYVANEVNPRILLLVTEAEVLKCRVSNIVTWVPVRNIIESCYRQFKLEQSYIAKRYTGFIIQRNFSVKALRRYPENWDAATKGEYLQALVAANQQNIRARFRQTTLSWPSENGKLPALLETIIKDQSEQNHNYSSNAPFDYLLLARDVYKHFGKLSRNIKAALGSKEGWVKQLEGWTPTLWHDIYDSIGWP